MQENQTPQTPQTPTSQEEAEKLASLDADPSGNMSQGSTSEPAMNPNFKLPIKEQKTSRKGIYAFIGMLAVIVVGTGAWVLLSFSTKMQQSDAVLNSPAPSSQPDTKKVSAFDVPVLETSKKYGDKYADGILPVGDDKYTTDSAKKGYIYACSQYAKNLTGGGAGTRGPWFVNDNKSYDVNKKLNVQGDVEWQGSFSNKVSGTTRTITTNNLPLSHMTGTFPISSSDPAYAYDTNPNTISEQDFTYSLSSVPELGDPQCMGGSVGVMLTGVMLFNGFDAGARDAGAWEVQDGCGGHPQKSGHYHYHTLSSCIEDTSVSTVIGYALDGFPITGPMVSKDNVLTTDDLDVCHGIKSEINVDGTKVTMYHYVMTQDFPYSVSCFRGKPATDPAMSQEGQQNSQPPDSMGQSTPPPSGKKSQSPPPKY